ncbi:MAG: oligosaccharide flippase family protein [Anaerolineales bacterium]|nr:oligosaccharide flippase family protein [Anaerolineales bacterium]
MRLAVSFGLLLRLIPRPRLGLQRAVGRGLLRESWPIGAGQGVRQAYERVSIIQLGAAMDAAAVGLFSGAARIFQLTDTMLTSFSTALFPAMSEAASVNGRLQKLTSDGLRALLSLALPASAFFLVFSPAFLPWLLGPEFADTAPALQIMAPAVTFAAISSLFSNLLRAIGRQRIDLYCMAGSLAINIALTALLIPSLGYLAPAVATVVSHGIYTLLASIVAFPVIRHVNGRQLIAPLASTLLMVVVWYLAREMPVLLRLAAGAVVYVVAMVVMKGIDMDFCRPVIESVRRSVRTQRSKPGR